MSWEATNWAVTQTAGSPGAKIVLLLLADRADDHHSCWPSQERLAVESEQSVATVRRRLRDLETLGLIATERRDLPGVKRATNRYVLAVVSTAQSERQNISTAQNDDLPLNVTDIYRSPVSAKPPVEPPKKEPPLLGFAEFWSIYPRKDAKKAAEKAWPKAVKAIGVDALLEYVVAFHQFCLRERKERRLIPHAATWLNGERWNDDLRDTAPPTKMQGFIAQAERLWDTKGANLPQLEG